MKRLTFCLILGLILSFCAYEVHKMLPERGALGKSNIANLGKSKIIRPGFAVAGTHIHSEDFPIIPQIAASPENQYDDQDISVCVDAVPDNEAVDGTLDTFALFGVIQWQVAEAQFGQTKEINFGGGLISTQEVLFDIHLGTSFTLPAAAAAGLKIRYVSISNAGFTGGNVLHAGPSVTVNAGYSYGGITPQNITYTQYIINGNDVTSATPFSLPPTAPGPAGTGTIAKPKFAQTCQIVWQNYIAATPLTVTFDGFITSSWGPISLIGGTLPPPLLPWPVDSWFLTVTNADAVDSPSFIKVISNLSL